MALIAQASQRRAYAMAAEESNKGVVSTARNTILLSIEAHNHRAGPQRLLPAGQYRELH
jgi:hypothetical protein